MESSITLHVPPSSLLSGLGVYMECDRVLLNREWTGTDFAWVSLSLGAGGGESSLSAVNHLVSSFGSHRRNPHQVLWVLALYLFLGKQTYFRGGFKELLWEKLARCLFRVKVPLGL